MNKERIRKKLSDIMTPEELEAFKQAWKQAERLWEIMAWCGFEHSELVGWDWWVGNPDEVVIP